MGEVNCDICDEAPKSGRLLDLRVTIESVLLDTKRSCFTCARSLGLEPGLEPGVCRGCGALLPGDATECFGCAGDGP